MTTQFRKIAAVLFTLSLLMTGCFKSKTKVFKLKPEDVSTLDADNRARLLKELKRRDGALYRLPRTVVLATVPVKKTTKDAGAFEKFAPCFFSKAEADDRTTSKTVEFSLGRVTFDSTGEPDPDETYVVLTRGGFFESKTLLMEYTPDMRLKKGEAESKNEGLEFVSKAAKTAVGIAARAAMAGALVNLDQPIDPASLAAKRFSTAMRAKQCYDLIKSYQENYLRQATDQLTKADAELVLANAAVAGAATPAAQQLAAQLKEKAEKKKKAAEANKKRAQELKQRADEDAAEMAKALREESLRARAASSTKALTGRVGGSGSAGSGSGGAATSPGTAPASPHLFNASSFSNAYGLAQALGAADPSTANPVDGTVTLADLAANIPEAQRERLAEAAADVEKHEETGPGPGEQTRWNRERARLRGAARQALVEALNAALVGPMVFAPADIAGVSLSAEALNLIAENPQGERLAQLNRALLEQTLAYFVIPRAPSPPDPSFTRHNLTEEYDRAEQTYSQLQELLKRQDSLMSGASNVPPDTFKQMLAQTTEGIAEYRESFLGEATEEDWEGVFNFRPKNDVAAQLSDVLFLFSPTTGVCAERGLIKKQGVRVSSKFADADCATHDADQKDRVAIWLRLDRKSNEERRLLSSLSLVNSSYDQENKERGWYFRIPAVGTVTLKRGALNPANIDTLANTTEGSVEGVETAAKAREAGRGDMAVAQLGVVASVPASAAGRTTQSSVVLDEATGALRNFKVSSDALLQKTLIDDAKEASDAIIEATDPLKRLQRENNLLDAKKSNREKRKALEEPPPSTNSNSNAGGGNP